MVIRGEVITLCHTGVTVTRCDDVTQSRDTGGGGGTRQKLINLAAVKLGNVRVAN